MIRIINARDENETPTEYTDIPSIDILRIPPRLCDALDIACATVEEFGIRSSGEAQWKTRQIRDRYFKMMAKEAATLDPETGKKQTARKAMEIADRWLEEQKDSRDIALAALWVSLATAGIPVDLRTLYDGELDYIEYADPLPVPKRPADHLGKAKAGSGSRQSALA